MTLTFLLFLWCNKPFSVEMYISGETEEEFSTRLAKNLEDLILKEGPETVTSINFYSCYSVCILRVIYCWLICFFTSDSCFYCWTSHGGRRCHTSSRDLFWKGQFSLNFQYFRVRKELLNWIFTSYIFLGPSCTKEVRHSFHRGWGYMWIWKARDNVRMWKVQH